MADFIEEGIVLSIKGNTAQVKITPKGTCPDNHVGCPVKALAEGAREGGLKESLLLRQIILSMPQMGKEW